MMNFPWLLKMAWRDSRKNLSRLVLFVSSIILGIAALVSIFALGDSLSAEIDNQAAALIGADLEISTNKPIPKNIQQLIDSIPGERAEQRSFASMVYFPRTNGTRLIQVRALEGNFPFYGAIETIPQTASRQFQQKRTALVDRSLMLQFNVKVGDSVRLGNTAYIIEGEVTGVPGQTGLSASVAPVVFIPLETLSATGLEQKGSRISTNYFFKTPSTLSVNTMMESMGPRLRQSGLNYDTITSKKEETARSFQDLARFLSLIGFIALLLGCIGVASAIHIYIREKINSIALLRCLGTTSRQAFIIYLIQIIVIGFIGSILGVLLGTAIQQLLPIVVQDLLPVKIHPVLSWRAMSQGLVLGVIISVLFALAPLMSIRKVSPLQTIRMSVQPTNRWDPVNILIYLIIAMFILVFTRLQLRSWSQAWVFTIGVAVAFGMLTLMAKGLMWSIRQFFPTSWSYMWRQGLSNLYRPNNQTTLLIVSIGLGTALICTLLFIESILLKRVTLSSSGSQPNMVLFDIQTTQKDSVKQLTLAQGLPVISMVPIVNMRLEKINNINIETVRKDSTIPIQPWVFNREYRVTFRDSLINSEKITKGKWHSQVENGTIYVSMDDNFATRNKINIGDTVTFNVQGSLIKTIVGSYRKVDWNRVQTNFLIVFPAGVLEKAPQFHVLMTHVPDVATSAKFQQQLVRTYPNISVIDLNLVLSILDDILGKIGFVIRFMAGFCIITGLIVLIASVLISKYQRIQESVLLRTLGASRRQIYIINAIEYFLIGAMAAFTGILLAWIAGALLASLIFETSFTPNWLPILYVFIAICGLTVLIGLINIRQIVNRSPLEILRGDN
ncbi:MAG: FtsX-like permease family protein [Chitinophagaceae bacterium]